MPTTSFRSLGPWLLMFTFLALTGACDNQQSAVEGETDDVLSGADLPSLAPNALRLVFPAGTEQVLCNGRLLDCVTVDEGCVLDLDAGAQGWESTVLVCQGVAAEADALFAPLTALAFKDNLPIWAPNLSAEGVVQVDARATALGTAFLSPLLTNLVPETARALLEQARTSPYLPELETAVASRDEAAAATALPPLLTDVLTQVALVSPLYASPSEPWTAEHLLGMDHMELTHTGSYLSVDSELGTSVDHLCVIYALEACVVDSANALAAVAPSDAFPKTELARVYVPAKSYFKYLDVAKLAIQAIANSLGHGSEEGEMIHLEPGRVHDIQCYSGAVGGSAEDREADAALMAAEPNARFLSNLARVANLVAVATDALSLLVDFDAFSLGDGANDVVSALAYCTNKALGPTLELSDGASDEELVDLVGTIVGCSVKKLVASLAQQGLYAVAKWAWDWTPGPGYLSKISKAGMILDRVVGLLIRFSPVERALVANAVDFDACHPCTDECPAMGAKACADGAHFRLCGQHDDDECMDWAVPTFCGGAFACKGEGECVACGEVDEPCCASGTCAAGNSCQGGVCVLGCAEECPGAGVSECADYVSTRSCGEHDGDACMEWGEPEDCAPGTICDDGACVLPPCSDDCSPGETRCGIDDQVETCGQCDADGCRDWCDATACDAHFVCEAGACDCGTADEDLPDAWPGAEQAGLDDQGGTWTVENALWPEGDADVLHAYVTDTADGTQKPHVEVSDIEAGVTYDLCVAFQCDPAVNSGEPTSVKCPDAIKTTRDGAPACCKLGLTGDGEVDIDIDCTLFGTGDDSGTATIYLDSFSGAQCWPRPRITFRGGLD